ncbi:peptidoglycan recognition protein-like [Ostrinia nubilalis]|uniref:peptidoglycan recognition protein-like n=1 Tax=Ostrinia nubilalis TaxID=29057 RepID=UPI00308241F7
MKLLVAIVVMLAVGGNTLGIIPITEWAGSEINRKQELANPVNMVVIQHTASKDCYSDKLCLQTVNNIRGYVMKIGFDDIPYSFMVGGNGKVYEGAGWHRVGAHTKGYNDKAIGIGFIGTFVEKLPSPEALKAAKELIEYGVQNNHIAGDYKLFGHRQLSSTVSPGDSLQKEIEGWPHWAKN